MPLVILGVSDPVVRETDLPDFTSSPGIPNRMRKAAFDQLHGPFQRYPIRSNDQVHMVRHDHEVMEQVASFLTVMIESLDEQFGKPGSLKQGAPLPSLRTGEVSAEVVCSLRSQTNLRG